MKFFDPGIQFCQHFFGRKMVKDLTSSFPNHSIYGVFIDIWWILMVNIRKYTSSMNPMGSLFCSNHHIRLQLPADFFFILTLVCSRRRPGMRTTWPDGAKSPESLYQEVCTVCLQVKPTQRKGIWRLEDHPTWWLITMVRKSPKWLNSWGEPNLLLTGTILQQRGSPKGHFFQKKVGGGHH